MEWSFANRFVEEYFGKMELDPSEVEEDDIHGGSLTH